MLHAYLATSHAFVLLLMIIFYSHLFYRGHGVQDGNIIYTEDDIPVDDEEIAYQWFKRAADKRHIKGMAMAGECLLHGSAVDETSEETFCQGLYYTAVAAELGSDAACFNLGYAFHKGSDNTCFTFCLPKDAIQAQYWLKKCLSSAKCTEKHVRKFHSRSASNLRLLIGRCNY